MSVFIEKSLVNFDETILSPLNRLLFGKIVLYVLKNTTKSLLIFVMQLIANKGA